MPSSLMADTDETSSLQEQSTDCHDFNPGYASGNNSNSNGHSTQSTLNNGRLTGLTMRHQDNNTQRSRTKSMDYSQKSVGTTTEFMQQTSSVSWTSGSLPFGTTIKGGGHYQVKGTCTPMQGRRQANLLRVRIERGLMVGMAFLAGYRMMTLDYSNIHVPQDDSSLPDPIQSDKMSGLARSAWALGAGFVMLALVHALFLTAHDHRLQFPLHNKNLPLQPLRKRPSRYLKTSAPPAVATVAMADDSEDDSEDDEALQRDIAAEIQQENLMQSQEATNGANCTEPAGKWQSRLCRSAELAIPQWRVWGSEAHWYRKGADNGSIFATVLVPVVLAAKYVQTVADERFSSTGSKGLYTAESVLSNMAFSLIFGVSILVHMLLLKAFDQIGTGSKQQHNSRKGPRSTLLESFFLPPAVTASSTPSTCMSTSNLNATITNGFSFKNLYPSHGQQAISSPSSASSPTLSAVSSAPSSVVPAPQEQQQQNFHDAFMFSADQLHHPSLLGSSETDKSSEREEIWIIALGFGGAYTCLVTLLARFKMIPGLENTGAGMVMLNQNLFQMLMIGFAYFFRRSFTFGELVILAQAITLLIHETLIFNFVTPAPSPPGTVLEHPQFMFLLALVVGMLFIGIVLTPILMYCRRLAQMPTKGASPTTLQKRELKKKVSAGVVYTGLIAIVLGIVMPRCERALGQNPFLWVIEFMLMTRIFSTTPPELLQQPGQSPASGSAVPLSSMSTLDFKFGLDTLLSTRIGWSRLGLCLYWILAVGCSIIFFYWLNASVQRRSIMGSLNNRRKFYHALAVMMFIPGYLADEPFMHLAFSVALAGLIFLEYIRYFAVVPFGKEIHLFLVGFLDARDGGPIILSHLYLLVGCAAPVWLAEQHILAGLSGIFALGVGDAMASIVGKRFGRHRWPGTIKTIEGTIAFVASVMVAAGTIFVGMWCMSLIFGDRSTSHQSAESFPPQAQPLSPPMSVRPASLLSFSTWADWSAVTWSVWGIIRYGVAVSIAAMLEAVSEQNDNLVIPVVLLSMVWLI